MSSAFAPPDSEASRINEWRFAAAGAVAIVMHAVLSWIVRARHLGTGNDDAVYLLLARALREGHYRELFYVGSPIHSQYPPGYPAFLAMLGAPSDGALGLVIAANILLSCTALALLFDVMRRWSAPLAVVAVAVLALNPWLVAASSRVQSEPLFMAAVMLALWALRPSADSRHRWIAITAVIVAALTRSAGVTIVAGILAHFLLARAWKAAFALTLVATLTIVPWIGWTVLAPQKIVGRSYIADAFVQLPRDYRGEQAALSESRSLSRAVSLGRTLVRRVARNTPAYLTRSLPTVLAIPTVPGTVVDNAAWLLGMLAALLAGVATAMRRWRPAVLVLAAYALLLVIWPYVIGRFVVPLLPVLIAVMLLGAWQIGGRLMPRLAIVPALALAAVPLMGGTRGVASMVREAEGCRALAVDPGWPCRSDLRRYRSVVDSLALTLPRDARVFTTKEGTFYYLTGRQVVSAYPAMSMEPAVLSEYLRQSQTTTIFLPHQKIEEWVLGPALAALCSEFTDARIGDGELLVLHARPPATGESDGCAAVERWRATW
ncbi:MAG TPA: hypothetical protein VMM77_12940 [Gemmatimonadaceae bacterium]|nr:hypothetical protein [Gemmatimonadaceae bacterium]